MGNMKYSLIFGITLICAMLFTACNDFFEPKINTLFEAVAQGNGVTETLEGEKFYFCRRQLIFLV